MAAKRDQVARPAYFEAVAAVRGDRVSDRCRAANIRLTAKRRALVAVFDQADRPVDVETAWRMLLQLGVHAARSSLYRLISTLVDGGLLVEARSGGRKTFIAAHKTMACLVETPDGNRLEVHAPELKAMLTGLAVDNGLATSGVAVIRFGERP